MRAAVLVSPGPVHEMPLTLLDLPELSPGPGEVLVDVLACAVCRTDLQLCEGDLAAQRLPIVPGHQVVGTISALGPDVVRRDGMEPGSPVGIAWLADSCGVCRHCKAGRENLCDDTRFTGWHRDGGFAEQVTARADFVYPLPSGFDPVAGAPLLCGGAIGLRSLRISGIEPGGRLGLYGFGASATCAIQIARHWGCDVFVSTRSETEQQRAIELGAVWAGGYEEAPPEPLDAAITFAPVGSVVVDALQALDKGGIVAINAIHLDHIPEIDYDDLWWERQIRSVANVTRADVIELMELAATIPIRTQVEEFELEDVNEALARLADGNISGAAVLRYSSPQS